MEKQEFKDKNVLVLGCGLGAAIDHIIKLKPKLIVAHDISSSVYPIAKRTKKYKNVQVIRGDIRTLPFKENTFDIIIADRVIHHVPEWKKNIKKIFSLVKKKGILSFNIISKENNFILMYIIAPFKKLLHRISNLKMMYVISFFITIPLFILIKSYSILAIFGINPPMHRTFKFWNKFGFNFLWKGTVFDMIQSPYTRFISRKDLEKMAKTLKTKKYKIQEDIEGLISFRCIKTS